MDIVDAATTLFARVPFDDVTVGDIAAAADMTPAAVYYHFASKEQILLEGVRAFSDDLLARVRAMIDSGMGADLLPTGLLDHVRRERAAAKVYFLASPGLNLSVEAHRRTVRAELSEMFAAAAARPGMSAAEAAVAGAAMVSLVEVAAASLLGRDGAARHLGSHGLSVTVAELTAHIVGSSTPG